MLRALTICVTATAMPATTSVGIGAARAPSMGSVIPFFALLLCIAVLPYARRAATWWHSTWNQLFVSLSAACATLLYYRFAFGIGAARGVLAHAVFSEYVPFIILLFSLYAVCGSIVFSGDLPARPATNTAFLAVGTLIASLVGTMGASMLLIRPLLQTNVERQHVRHTVIFFMFLVSNVGGCLLPTGDPPLFLGFLSGVPFFWTLNLWKEWAFVSGALLAIYFLWDRVAYCRESRTAILREELETRPLRLSGGLNFAPLMGIVLSAAFVRSGEPIPGTAIIAFPYLRELLMLMMVGVSRAITPPLLRISNSFGYHPMKEIAALFIGIFISMQAPIEILRASNGALSPYLGSPAALFWSTGLLSSFLDNAPTYQVVFEAAVQMTPHGAVATIPLGEGRHIMPMMLEAISLGAVFMGAMTYIGNGPNFMIRNMAERSGVKMPGFFGFLVYSGCVLIPLYGLVTLLFL